jgi:hypothetical protein
MHVREMAIDFVFSLRGGSGQLSRHNLNWIVRQLTAASQELPLHEPWAQAKVLELLESIDLFNAAAQRFNDLHMQASESPRVTYSYEHWRLLTHAEKIVETVNELQPVLLGIAGSRTHMVSRIEVAEGE